jgi:hypothetical protein
MILISIEEDKKTISSHFRKAVNFAFVKEGENFIEENLHKNSRLDEFFDYFKTLNVQQYLSQKVKERSME